MTPRKPRKIPKNQRAYPKKGKPRMVEISPDESSMLAHSDDIGSPAVSYSEGKFYAKADEMRKWRGPRVTSGVEHD